MIVTDFAKIFDALNREKVRYVVVGGVAAIGYGIPHTTTDIDICYERTKENIEALVRALKPSSPKLRVPEGSVPFLFDEKTIMNGLNFTLLTDWGMIDLLGELSGVGDYNKLLSRAEKMAFYGLAVNTISLEDLIKAKKIAGRNKDKLHLMDLEALQIKRES